jgi:hypothetical protein
MLANWSSDASVVANAIGGSGPVAHQHVLAWVVLGRHGPIEPVNPESANVPCYFGTSIQTVDATSGATIAVAYHYDG